MDALDAKSIEVVDIINYIEITKWWNNPIAFRWNNFPSNLKNYQQQGYATRWNWGKGRSNCKVQHSIPWWDIYIKEIEDSRIAAKCRMTDPEYWNISL